MFDHVTIRAADRAASERFYATVLQTLGHATTHAGENFSEWDDFSVAQATGEKPATRGLHIGFVSPSREHVDRFWRAGIDAGHPDEGAPGPRPEYRDDYYGAFLLDPDGNSAEAVHDGALRQGGSVDHLWIRVADVWGAAAFYEVIAPYAGLRPGTTSPERAQFRGASGSFSLVAGDRPTANLHMAFPAADTQTVDAFHAAAVAAGYTDNGAPGERPEYHAGYYGAFVLDPDGNNIEVVHHDRSQG